MKNHVWLPDGSVVDGDQVAALVINQTPTSYGDVYLRSGQRFSLEWEGWERLQKAQSADYEAQGQCWPV